MTLGAQDNFVFVEVDQKLWGPEHGDPGSVGVTTATHKASKFKGKLRGAYAFPFSLTLPSTVPLKHGPYDQYTTPSTFNGLRISIGYMIQAKVTRGGFMSSGYEWVTFQCVEWLEVADMGVARVASPLTYTQRIQPGLPSPARQLAYLQGNPLLGPVDDPQGWHTLTPVDMRGKVFESEDVTLQCTVCH